MSISLLSLLDRHDGYRKLNVSKHLYKCSQGEFKIMPFYQTNDDTLLQIKGKKL